MRFFNVNSIIKSLIRLMKICKLFGIDKHVLIQIVAIPENKFIKK